MESLATSSSGPKNHRIQRVIALGALAVLAATCLLPPHEMHAIRAGLVAAGMVPTIAGFLRRGPGAAIAVVSSTLELLFLVGLPWLGIVALGLVVLVIASRREVTAPYARIPRGDVPGWLTLACAGVTPVALTGWAVLLRPDMSDLAAQLPKVATPLLVFGSIAFAISNALFEEWIWRGIFQARLSELFPASMAIGIVAISFGIAHTYGFPRGPTGVALASTWALMLGVLRMRAKGLRAPVLAHFVADITIAQLLIFWFR
jgi:uncharacterized protein